MGPKEEAEGKSGTRLIFRGNKNIILRTFNKEKIMHFTFFQYTHTRNEGQTEK
ncbi:MAG TPA: hypothetical protein IAB26_00735 [Candidatus Limivivens merdigallinarum]|uniref:Uncharacterized protein n=1 Tax=Candidatus Limivivens merdigallinarum TaxID=2840859 RepID=A0A9D0ZTD9_9FIRM|nr:hypothetical protein [Candidatus Limivivens merdigallinarum]